MHRATSGSQLGWYSCAAERALRLARRATAQHERYNSQHNSQYSTLHNYPLCCSAGIKNELGLAMMKSLVTAASSWPQLHELNLCGTELRNCCLRVGCHAVLTRAGCVAASTLAARQCAGQGGDRCSASCHLTVDQAAHAGLERYCNSTVDGASGQSLTPAMPTTITCMMQATT